YSREELYTLTSNQLTHHDDRLKTCSLIAMVLAGTERDCIIEQRYIQKNGHIVWVNVAVALLRTTNEEAARLVVIVQDIDAQKQAEQGFRHVEAQLHLTVKELQASRS